MTELADAPPSSDTGDEPRVALRGQRHPGHRSALAPASARRPTRGTRHHLAEGRLLAVGAVRLLHRVRRRQGDRVVPDRPRQGRGRVDRHARRRRRNRTPDVRRRVRRVRRTAVRVLHPRHRDAGQSADRQEGRRRSPARRWRRTSARICAAAPGTSRSSTRSRPSPRARSCAPALSAEVGGGGAKYEAAPLTLGDRGYIDDIRVPGHAPRSAPPHRPRPRRRRRRSTRRRRSPHPASKRCSPPTTCPASCESG